MFSEVPEGWSLKRFGEIASVKNGFAFKSKDFVESNSCVAAVVRMSDLKNGTVEAGLARKIPLDCVQGLEKFRLEIGDFVFGMSGSLSNYAVVPATSFPLYLNQRVGKLEAKDADASFLRFLYTSDDFMRLVEKSASGNAQLNISGKQIESFEVIVPPLNEQHRIAEILSSVDASIQATQAVIDQAERVKRGLMEELLTGGLGSETIERGEVPEGWQFAELKDCLTKVIDYRGKAPPKASNGVPLITAKNIRKGFLSFADAEYIDAEQYKNWMVKGLPRAGDILFTTEAPLGNVAMFPIEGLFALGQRTITLRCNKRLESTYLFYLLQSKLVEAELQLRATGTTAKGIKSKEFQKIKVLFPSIAEQIHIAKILASFDESMGKQKTILEQQTRLKKGLMDDLLTGKVRTIS